MNCRDCFHNSTFLRRCVLCNINRCEPCHIKHSENGTCEKMLLELDNEVLGNLGQPEDFQMTQSKFSIIKKNMTNSILTTLTKMRHSKWMLSYLFFPLFAILFYFTIQYFLLKDTLSKL